LLRIFYYECNLLRICCSKNNLFNKEKLSLLPKGSTFRIIGTSRLRRNRLPITIRSQTRVHRRNRWDKEGGIAHSISSAGSLRSPSLTGGPTSRVRPLPIQITLIGGSPLVYTCASYGTRKSGTEKEKARIPEWKKMGSNLARVNKKIGSWKRDGRRGMNRNFQIKRILLSITIIK